MLFPDLMVPGAQVLLLPRDLDRPRPTLLAWTAVAEHARARRKHLLRPDRNRRILSWRSRSRSHAYRNFRRLLSCGSISRYSSCSAEIQ